MHLKTLKMSVTVKEEIPDNLPPSTSVEALDIESRIISLCQEFPKGINDKILQNDMPNIDASQRVKAINRLLSQGRIDLFKQGNQLLYRLKDPEAAKKVKGADNEEKIVYKIIEEAGNKGIWIRDIRNKSNLSLTLVNKILKSLESKKLIKAVKSVAASKKKVYMLFNLQPDQSITGGAWYSDQDFESEFVEVLNQQCLKFLQMKAATGKTAKSDPISQKNYSYASSKEILDYITELGISKVQLSIPDIETILNTLIYDGNVEKSVLSTTENVNVYRAIERLVPPTPLMRMPCGVCPVINQCSENGIISPSTCVYMKEWLEY